MATNRIERAALKALNDSNGDASAALRVLRSAEIARMVARGSDEVTAAYWVDSSSGMLVLREAIRRVGGEWARLHAKAAA